jgi:hypothetical protein
MGEPFRHPLGLKASEYRLILNCHAAYQHVSNGHFLPATRWFKAAKRMIERGYLTEVPGQLMPSWPDWIVVVLTKANAEKYNADLAATVEKEKT